MSTVPTVPPVVVRLGTPQVTAVRLSGLFVEKAGVVRACPPYAVAGVGRTTVVSGVVRELPDVPGCVHGIPVSGLDVGRLDGRQSYGGTTWGSAAVTATYDGSRLTVTGQRPPDRWASPDRSTPCPEPAAGWRRGPVGHGPGVAGIQHLVQVQPARFGTLSLSRPSAADRASTPTLSTDSVTEVLVVGVTGDVTRERQALARVFPGNLCVVHSPVSAATVQQQVDRLSAVLERPEFRGSVIGWGGGERSIGVPILHLDVPFWTAQLQQVWVELGRPAVDVEAWLTITD
ncbi:hypothetical protein [Nakamurella endophytica]|uniref:hypothetical protein n=1 Tax=Nakamurella endophytica TaxID=1748367 RepID=UPI001666E281|nr:hypothetical protein [Nakamurella endophytica]